MKIVILILFSSLFVINGEFLYAQKPIKVSDFGKGVKIFSNEHSFCIAQNNSINTILYYQGVAQEENSELNITVNRPVQIPEDALSIDIILLMGQSNMKGRGKLPENQEINPRIIYMNMTNDDWYPAIHPLHTDGVPDLIDGKSNAGVGPGLDFAKVLAEKDSNACIALIPCAKGGSWIDLWMPGTKLYNEMIRRTKKALADFSDEELTVNIKTVLWLQGESDAIEGRYQKYESKLKVLVKSLRSDLELPELPFISATIGTFMEDISCKYPYYKEINETLLRAGKIIDNYSCVDARDLSGDIGDHIHYNSSSQQEIGERMAQVYLKMTVK